MAQLVRDVGFTKYAIYREGLDLFAYFEAPDIDGSTRLMRADPRCAAWLRQLAPMMDAADPMDPWEPMEETFWLP